MSVKFISESDGIKKFALENKNSVKAEIITYGARIFKLFLPVGDGIDVVAGFNTPSEFKGDNPYFNAVIGRVCNRIAKARFTLADKTYHLYANDGENHLHGGKGGFDRKIWDAEIVGDVLRLRLTSPDMQEGYPGTLKVTVDYELTDGNELKLTYRAKSDKDTICNLTNHAYFNLDGDFESVLNHIVTINADFITTVDDELIPSGDLTRVDGTPYDFKEPKKIGKDISVETKMLTAARGYDFNYVLNRTKNMPCATVYSEKSGVKMSVFTDEPCMQFYTGNFLDGIKGKKTYGYQSAFCMETQNYPNACNVPSFKSTVLKKGEEYFSTTTYKFDF